MTLRIVGLFASILLFLGVKTSEAAFFQVTLTAGASSVTIMDGGVGDFDFSVGPPPAFIPATTPDGIIRTFAVIGGYTFDLTLAVTNTPGSPLLAFVNAGTNSISGSGATTVSIYASAGGFTAPSSPPPLMVMTGATAQLLPGTAPGNSADVSVKSFYDPTNTASTTATGTLIGSDSVTGLTAPQGNVSLLDQTSFSFVTTPYALNLELKAIFNNSGNNAIDVDGTLMVTVPEPASFALLGVGLAVTGFAGWRRSRREAA